MRRDIKLLSLCASFSILLTCAQAAPDSSFIGPLKAIQKVASTVPSNGDVNPYGVAVVPQTTGSLVKGDILVSNFNNAKNLQGTGTTIDAITPGGGVKLFAHIDATKLPGPCPGGVGLTTALVVLRSGWVIVGSLPTADGMAATAKAGCLIVLNRSGQPVETLSGGDINGPWDMIALDMGSSAVLFISNVLNGTVAANGAIVHGGTVLRIVLSIPDESESESDRDGQAMPRELARGVIGSGFEEKTDPNALVIGPTGLGLGENGTLYVADTLQNRIAAIPGAIFRTTIAGTGETVSQGKAINGPLGLAIAPNDNILTVNSNDGNMVETTPGGAQVAVRAVDATGMGAGTLFGLAVTSGRDGVYFVNDGNNALYLLHH
jgi:hypothetical protein